MIVPVAAGDHSWQGLLNDLAAVAAQTGLSALEVLFVGSDAAELDALQHSLSRFPGTFQQQVSTACAGHSRATAMNAGAALAQGEYLWFVHADSRLTARHIRSLQHSIAQSPDALHYFNLRFYGHPLMWLNSLGVWLRSHWLATPFGDQALCLSQQNFFRIGTYPEAAGMGEDHILVWHALQQGIKLRCTGTALFTSARKYVEQGWLKTTGWHVYLWARQAWPEFKVLLRTRWRHQRGKAG
ncbi:MAG: glycosyl transferase family 2 [Thiothrix nivea]|nr:MAG: glycosyl transferase family 2 [Thiothrix nivea]